MNVELGDDDDDDDEPLETEIENNVQEPQLQSEQDNDIGADSKISSEESQLFGMVMVVWVLVIIGVIVFTVSTVVKKRRSDEVQTVYVESASGMYAIDTLSAEEDCWTDYITSITKNIQTNGNTVTFYLTGKAKNYNKIVYIPVTQDEYNSVQSGTQIEFVFSRLYIDGTENILIRRWNVYAGK
jgi:hypothetical protein